MQEACEEGKTRKMIGFSFPAEVDQIAKALDIYEAFLVNNGVSGLEVFELMTIFYEVATNIRLHGKLEMNAVIDFSASIHKCEVVMEFKDPGRPFNPVAEPSEFNPSDALKAGKMRGLGIILINRLIDSLSYSRSDDEQNILCLKKNICNNRGSREDDTASNNK